MSPEGENPNVIPFNRERRIRGERAVILLSALQVAKGKIDDLRLYFGKKDVEEGNELDFVAVTEKYTTDSFLSLCFEDKVPPQFDGPIVCIIAVSGKSLGTQLEKIEDEGVHVIVGRHAQKIVCNAFSGLKDFVK